LTIASNLQYHNFTMWLYPVIAVIIVSLLSLIGAVFMIFKRPVLSKFMSPLLALSSGVLLGSAFFDLIPESMELIPDHALTLVIVGIITFFSLEKLLQWHHHTEGDHHHDEKTPGYLSLLGDGIHNFIDGIMIGGAFLVSVPLGITVTIAVIAHEIPHELADFTILLHSGFSNTKALWYNFLSATTSIVGALLVLWVGTIANSIIPLLVPFGAGNFLYIAMSDLIPELHQRRSRKTAILQIILLSLGASLIYFMPAE
jgi:zinc and cadmium transporter